VNVWFALSHRIHPQHPSAGEWAGSLLHSDVAYFCRFTQLGLLRLLTNQNAMGDEALTQREAWSTFDAFLNNAGNRMIEEPRGIDPVFRRHTDRDEASTKQWADGYLAAFAQVGGLTLVTFDRALAGRVKGAVLLV
jgi:toxin-antitoxin system PIN domain toxin